MRETRAHQVAQRIRASIQNGEFLSGERLIELTLSRTYAVSQNTIRDALHLLENEGWVVKRPRQGVFIRSFSREEAGEVYALVAVIEDLALTWMMEHLTRGMINDLRGIIESARRHANLGEWQQAIEALFRFHQALGMYAGRPITARILEQLYNHARLLEAIRQARAPRNPLELDAFISRHELLVQRIAAKDEVEARRLLREQIAAYSALTLSALAL